MYVFLGTALALSGTAKRPWTHHWVQRTTYQIAGKPAAESVRELQGRGAEASVVDALPVAGDVLVGAFGNASLYLAPSRWRR
jgi:hypothetical protein